MKNIGFAISNWSTYSLNWLQHKVCTGYCDSATTYSTFSNIKITTGVDTAITEDTTETGESTEPTTDVPVKPATIYPSLEVAVDDVARTLYVHYPDWCDNISAINRKLSFDYNNRMYLSTVEKADPTKYFKANLLGGSISFDVDISMSGCGCLTALYTVAMPATENSWDEFKYCDANQVGGYFCPEFDIMEANRHAYRSTAHSCERSASAGFGGSALYPNCDRDG